MNPLWFRCAIEQRDRFWRKVRRLRDDDACWLWRSGRTSCGYGKFAVTLPREKGKTPQKHTIAHRLAYMFTHGFTDEIVRHDCDTPLCCNPKHLRTGTQADNRRDCVERGRQPRGEQSSQSKLKLHQVKTILRSRGRVTCEVLAARYGVCIATIAHIWVGRNWGWVAR